MDLSTITPVEWVLISMAAAFTMFLFIAVIYVKNHLLVGGKKVDENRISTNSPNQLELFPGSEGVVLITLKDGTIRVEDKSLSPAEKKTEA